MSPLNQIVKQFKTQAVEIQVLVFEKLDKSNR